MKLTKPRRMEVVIEKSFSFRSTNLATSVKTEIWKKRLLKFPKKTDVKDE